MPQNQFFMLYLLATSNFTVSYYEIDPAVKEYIFAHSQGERKRLLTMARPQI